MSLPILSIIIDAISSAFLPPCLPYLLALGRYTGSVFSHSEEYLCIVISRSQGCRKMINGRGATKIDES